MIDESLLDLNLCTFLDKDLGLTALAESLARIIKDRGSLGEFVEVMLSQSGYASEDELQKVAESIEAGRAMTPFERCRERGNFLFKAGKYAKAAGICRNGLL